MKNDLQCSRIGSVIQAEGSWFSPNYTLSFCHAPTTQSIMTSLRTIETFEARASASRHQEGCCSCSCTSSSQIVIWCQSELPKPYRRTCRCLFPSHSRLRHHVSSRIPPWTHRIQPNIHLLCSTFKSLSSRCQVISLRTVDKFLTFCTLWTNLPTSSTTPLTRHPHSFQDYRITRYVL